MYKINFSNHSEIRMGSPYSIADIDIVGEFIPPLNNVEFQDKYALSEDGKVCFIIEWSIEDNKPGFIIWRLCENEQSVIKSKRYAGCCHSIEYINGRIKIELFVEGKLSTEILMKSEWEQKFTPGE